LRKQSKRDAAFVARASEQMGLPCYLGCLASGRLSAGGSLEEAARRGRLDFLFKTAARAGANKIALGHNFDDQAETVLMRLLRGTGLYGLAGILPRRDMGGKTIIRPLIQARRKEIETYLAKRGLKPRRDATNKQDIYFRNKIRNKLLPLLEKEYNKNIREVLTNMSETAASDYDYLRRVAASTVAAGRAGISVDKLVSMHAALRRMCIRNAITALKGDTRRISFSHIREVEDLLLRRPANSVVDLPGGISAVKKKNKLFFYTRAAKNPALQGRYGQWPLKYSASGNPGL